MRLRATRFRALNSLLYIKGVGKADDPAIDGLGCIWSTPSCIAVGCTPDCDGPTEVMLGDAVETEQLGLVKIFEGTLETPDRVLVVETVLGDKLIEQPVPSALTSIQIWNDGHTDSGKILIGVN